MVIGKRGYMLAESTTGKLVTRSNTVCIPLYREAKQMTTKYYAFWLKTNSNQLIEDFASNLYQIFHSKKK